MIFQWVPDIFEAAVVKTATVLGRPVYFDYGHYEVVTQNIQEKTDSKLKKAMKYPLVWLKMDFPERIDASRLVQNKVTCDIVFATETESDYTMKQRRDLTFIPVLYPIMQEFLNQLGISAGMPYGGATKWDHPYWGITSGKDNGPANLFNDYIDAIELRGLELPIKRKIC